MGILSRNIILVFAFLCTGWGAYAQDSASEPYCAYDAKDYDSEGFGIPRRSGFFIVGRFGCVYRCSCDGLNVTKVTHVLQEKHLDLNVLSDKTGGPERAKWFICPRSIKPGSWSPIRDELGRIIAYNADLDYTPFPASKMSSSIQITNWASSCGK